MSIYLFQTHPGHSTLHLCSPGSTGLLLSRIQVCSFCNSFPWVQTGKEWFLLSPGSLEVVFQDVLLVQRVEVLLSRPHGDWKTFTRTTVDWKFWVQMIQCTGKPCYIFQAVQRPGNLQYLFPGDSNCWKFFIPYFQRIQRTGKLQTVFPEGREVWKPSVLVLRGLRGLETCQSQFTGKEHEKGSIGVSFPGSVFGVPARWCLEGNHLWEIN